MVWQSQKKHSPAVYRLLEMNEPGFGGLNIQDLDYTLPLNQSPKMLNMMVNNGAFGKRYGQKIVHTFESDIKNIGKYKNTLYIHVGNKLIKYDDDTETTIFENENLAKKGIFINYNKMLYFLNGDIFLQYDGTTCSPIEPYIPDVLINMKPDGSYADVIEDYNRLGGGFKNNFNGDGTSKNYFIRIPKQDDDDVTGLDPTEVKITVDTTELKENTDFTVNRETGEVTFNTAPAKGQNNVVITAYKAYKKYTDSIMNCKHYAVYGGQNNSRLFLAGNGTATYYFSGVFDATYFPETQYAVVGNSEDDITGFGAQYNVLVVFKPTEMYALQYQFTTDSNGEEKALFYSAQINVDMGCDMPDTIHYVDNRLTWGSTQWGVCTLCSTVIEDERNVRVISRNVNGGYREDGILAEENLKDALAVNFEGRYILCINDNAYAWDYTNAPYNSTDRLSPDESAKRIAWFKWDNFGISCYKVLERVIYYGKGANLCTFTHDYNDFGEPIHSYYQTPMLDFSAFQSLKTIKKAFFQVRGDTPCHISIKYITDENPEGESDPEDIDIPAKLWDGFGWTKFGWSIVSYAKTFARKCSVKKVMLFGMLLSNEELNRNMSLTGIKCEYTVVKEIK